MPVQLRCGPSLLFYPNTFACRLSDSIQKIEKQKGTWYQQVVFDTISLADQWVMHYRYYFSKRMDINEPLLGSCGVILEAEVLIWIILNLVAP